MSQVLSVVLPDDVAVAVAQRVLSGAYDTESEVVSRAVLDLISREETAEARLCEDAAEAYDELRDHPCLAWSVRDVRTHLAEVHTHYLDRPRP